ncbi:glycosyltransferase family 4 protein [Salinimicrobium soli]|uniref:glycosyltransferase family 4 protein n=1 Tax=Salinimicrobium soli TaxID=1254399 RepID=UPI003AAF958E
MKILHLSAVRNWGGGEQHIENLCLEMAKNHSEVLNIVLCRKGSRFEHRLKKQNFRYYTSPLLSNFDFRYALKIISTCKKESIDLIHIHDPKALTLAIIADHFYELPPLVFSKKTSFPIRQNKGTLYKYNYKKLQKILCVSKTTKNLTFEYLERLERLKVIYHGTRIDNKSTETPFRLRDKLGLQEETVIIGNVANHIEAKDLETFLKTVRYLVKEKKQENLHFVQMGRFSRITPVLQELIEKWDLEKHISMLGFLPDASNFIPQFDATLLTSENEGIPQVIYESFYHRVPVVSTRAGGISEVIEHKVNGLLAECYDHRELGENLLFLKDNPQLIPTFTEISKNKLLKGFTAEKMAKQTLEEYKKVINGH